MHEKLPSIQRVNLTLKFLSFHIMVLMKRYILSEKELYVGKTLAHLRRKVLI